MQKRVKREEPMTNQPPDWLHFWQRPFPSANTLLIEDEKPVLIDSGFGRDVPALLRRHFLYFRLFLQIRTQFL